MRFDMAKVTIYFLTTALAALLQIDVNVAYGLPELQPETENAKLDFIDLFTRYGHRPVRHKVTTEDGYVLTIFRVPGESKYPLMLMHGLFDTSDTWLLRGENSLGVTLAKDGYDLWFPNSRGNRYSREHLFLDPDKNASYWNWSFHELGYYDLPATIDMILNETQATSLSAIAHSRGNLIFYTLGATRPEYNKKVNVMIALAPICYFHHSKPPLTTLFQALPLLYTVVNYTQRDGKDALGYNSTLTKLLRHFCTYPLVGNQLCLKLIIYPYTGFDPQELEPAFVNVFIYHFPAGSSWKDILHFAQLRKRGVYAQYDYGSAKNLQIYASSTPPLYNLAQVTMPIALLAGRNDPLSTVQDVRLLRDQLGNVVDFTINKRAMLTHADHVWGKNMRDYLFPDIYRVLKRYNNI